MFAQVGDRRGETPKIILNIEGNPKISNQSTGNVFGDNIGRDKGPFCCTLLPQISSDGQSLEVAGLFSRSKIICGATVFDLYMSV
jgi:hypothetical protein